MTLPVLLLTKVTAHCEEAGAIAKRHFQDRLRWVQGRVGAPLDGSLRGQKFAAVISFVSPWIVPQWLLDAAPLALNFHPGSCDYPGIGCYNFALFEGAKRYGPVCHHMLAKVDTGGIVKEELFEVAADERVETLKLRTMNTMVQMFDDICALIAQGATLPTAARHWQRPPFTRKQLNELGRVSFEMAHDQVQRRIRAMEYPGFPGAFVEVAGVKFYAPSPQRPPLA